MLKRYPAFVNLHLMNFNNKYLLYKFVIKTTKINQNQCTQIFEMKYEDKT